MGFFDGATTGAANDEAALATAPSGAVARILRIGLDAAARRHLAALGVRRGALLDVVRNLGPDGVVIGLAEDRLSLPHRAARAILVEPILRHARPGGDLASAPAF